MTLEQLNKRIQNLRIVLLKSSGLQAAELGLIIDDLETARVDILTEALMELNLPDADVQTLDQIANTFNNAAGEIENVNTLIDNTISIGKRLAALLA